ncbi:MAG: SHOCT domain-containing protein [Actinomycetota bacterium]
MRRRMGRPGLLGTMARTAVVAGTASTVVGATQRRQANKAQEKADEQAAQQAAVESQQQLNEMQAQVNAMQQQQQQPQQAAAPAAGGNDMMAELERLGQLKANGILTDEEFAAAKAKVLGT